MHDTYDEVSLLKSMNNMLLKDIERLKAEEAKADMKRLSYLFKKFPLMFPIILDTYFEILFQKYFGSFFT